MTFAEHDAAVEGVIGAHHAAAHIFGIPESAERRGLQLSVAGLASQGEAAAMLPDAALRFAARKAEIAAQEMNARLLGDESIGGRRSLGGVEVGPGAGEIVRHALDLGEPDQGAATPGLARRRLERAGAGGQRRRHVAKIMEDVAEQQLQREAIGGLDSDSQTAFDQSLRRLVAISLRLRARGLEIGARRARVLRAVEMLGRKRSVATVVPFGRAQMQLAAARLQ